MNKNKQFEHNVTEQVIQLKIFNVVHQAISSLQIREQVIMSQTFITFVVQRRNVLLFVFDGMVSVIDILIDTNISFNTYINSY